MIFLVNLMFRRLDKFDEGGHIYEELIFGMLIGLHIWRAYIRRGSGINGILRYIPMSRCGKQ